MSVLDDNNNNNNNKVAYRTGNNAHHFQGQRSRSPGRLMLRRNVRHICQMGWPRNFKIGTPMEHVLSTIISQKQKVPESAKLVDRLPMPRTIMCTSFKVTRSDSEVKVSRSQF